MPDVLGLVNTLIKFYFHDGVRVASAACIPLLFSSLVKAEHVFLDRWHETAGCMIEALECEPDPEFAVLLFATLSEVWDGVGVLWVDAWDSGGGEFE